MASLLLGALFLLWSSEGAPHRSSTFSQASLTGKKPGKRGGGSGSDHFKDVSLQATAVAAPNVALPNFLIDTSNWWKEEDALRDQSGECGAPSKVEIISAGEGGIWAGRSVLRVPANAYEIFQWLTHPEINFMIFNRHVAAVNYRKLLEEDTKARRRLFEVSKTGKWSLMGIPLSYESTAYAVEDWNALQISYRLKKPGAMKHMSGFWRMVPVGQDETLVLFYHEAVPSFPVPAVFRHFAKKICYQMARSLPEDLREFIMSRRHELTEEHREAARSFAM